MIAECYKTNNNERELHKKDQAADSFSEYYIKKFCIHRMFDLGLKNFFVDSIKYGLSSMERKNKLSIREINIFKERELDIIF